MAVLAEAISVIVRRSAVDAKFPGGCPAFASAAPNLTFCADGEIARVGFMSPADVEWSRSTIVDPKLIMLLIGNRTARNEMRGRTRNFE